MPIAYREDMGAIGDFDPLGIVSNAISTAVDDVKSAIGAIPGIGGPLVGAMTSLVNGPLRDFANTAVGKITLTLIAGAWANSLSWTVGPQIASGVFALPGMACGDSFEQAWISDFKSRCEELASILGPQVSQVVGNEVSQLCAALSTQYGVGQPTPDFTATADAYKTRDDSAAYAKAIVEKGGCGACGCGDPNQLPDPNQFDPLTGKWNGRKTLTQGLTRLNVTPVDLMAQQARDAAAAQFKDTVTSISNFHSTSLLSQYNQTPPPSAPPPTPAPPNPAAVRAVAPSTGMSKGAQIAIVGGLGAVVAGVAFWALR